MSYTMCFIFERASSNQHLMAQGFKAARLSGKQTTLSFGFDSISLYMAVWHQYALSIIIIEDLSILVVITELIDIKTFLTATCR
jgi:hypothetical protein